MLFRDDVEYIFFSIYFVTKLKNWSLSYFLLRVANIGNQKADGIGIIKQLPSPRTKLLCYL